jgi:phospholipase D1/2
MGLKNSEYSTIHRYNSFAPIRQNCGIDFFVDGADYYKEVALALLQARKEVFISGWWVSPQFYLIRPVTSET